jgi:hypothetical protein
MTNKKYIGPIILILVGLALFFLPSSSAESFAPPTLIPGFLVIPGIVWLLVILHRSGEFSRLSSSRRLSVIALVVFLAFIFGYPLLLLVGGTFFPNTPFIDLLLNVLFRK